MITTLPGTTIAVLSILGGENHTNGWFFYVAGSGPYDDLFTIVDSDLKVAANAYVPPGDITINLVASHITYGLHVITLHLSVGDSGYTPSQLAHIYTPSDHFPPLGTTYEFILNFRYGLAMTITDNEVALIKFDVGDHVTLYADGSIRFAPQTADPTVTLAAGTITFDIAEWNKFRIIREDRGSGLRTYYEFNDEVLHSIANDPLLDITKFTPCHHISGTDTVEVANVRVNIDDVTYVQEELNTGLGVFIFDPA